MNNEITIRLSDEDRALLGAILNELTNLSRGDFAIPQEWKGEKMADKVPNLQENHKNEPETVKNEPVKQETEPVKAEPAPAPAAPTVSKADVQKLVVTLASSGKKAEVKEIVTQYAASVSAIPEDKLAEVYEKLQSLQ